MATNYPTVLQAMYYSFYKRAIVAYDQGMDDDQVEELVS